jgi:hypothetical protein
LPGWLPGKNPGCFQSFEANLVKPWQVDKSWSSLCYYQLLQGIESYFTLGLVNLLATKVT